ncbi:hypothetical protein PIB30_110304, partial [Stylosanthes scabra]|nr:hypothetical protein [Stylosanthes scabra]
MASTSFNNNNEGLSTTRPPLWIRAQDIRIWKVIEQGNHVPMKKSSATVGESTTTKETLKLESEFSEEDWKKMSLNDKAINFIHCALNENDYMKISRVKP